MSSPIPAEHSRRITALRDQARSVSDALATHARDLMVSGMDLDALARVQLVRAYVDGATVELEHALREAGAD